MNLLGAPGYHGIAKYSGFEKVLEAEGAHLHLYGKKETRPYRKMGHVNITGNSIKALMSTYKKLKNVVKVTV